MQWEKEESLEQMVLRQLDSHTQKDELRSLCHTTYESYLK